MRRSSRLAAVSERVSPDVVTLASLPLPLAHRIFLALPVDARGRACCVCRAWRDLLADPSLWTRLDLSDVDVEWQRFAAMLHGAAGRARGGLRDLDVSHVIVNVRADDLLPVLTANAGSLRKLHLCSIGSAADDEYKVTGEAVVAAAPLLQVLTAEYVSCKWEDAPRLLRAEAPLTPLRLRVALSVYFDDDADDAHTVGGLERVAPFAAALADAALQPAFSHVCIWYAHTAQPAVMDALVDAALARRLRKLELHGCTPPAAAPLARLLAEGSLAVFEFEPSHTNHMPLFDAAGATLVADALRVNTTLTNLRLIEAQLCLDIDAAGILLGVLVGHPSLRELWIFGEAFATEDRVAVGTAVAALIAADSPALLALKYDTFTALGDAGLAPIVAALPLNRHLRTLDLDGNSMSDEFAREQLLPAVEASEHDAPQAQPPP